MCGGSGARWLGILIAVLGGMAMVAYMWNEVEKLCESRIDLEREKTSSEESAHTECKGNVSKLQNTLGTCYSDVGQCDSEKEELQFRLSNLDFHNASNSSRVWRAYNAIFDIRSLSLSHSGIEWPIYSKDGALDELHHGSPLICITGKFNSGKSKLVSDLYGTSLPVGDSVPTIGLSTACLQAPNRHDQDCIIDSQGYSTPIGPLDKGERLQRKLLQDLQTDICLQAADSVIWVVGDGITSREQDRMIALKVDRSAAMFNKQGARLIVVHNFRTATSKNALKAMWDRFTRDAFPDMEMHQYQESDSSVPYEYGATMLVPPDEDTMHERGSEQEGEKTRTRDAEVVVTHFALVNEGSRFGREYNAAVRRGIFQYIKLTRDLAAGQSWTLMDRIMAPLQERDWHKQGLISRKYIDDAHFMRTGRAPMWTVLSDFSRENESHRHLCHAREDVSAETCSKFFGDLPLSKKMALTWPSDSKITYYATVWHNVKRSDAIQSETCVVTATGERRVVILLAGCGSFGVKPDRRRQRVFVSCNRTQHAFGGVPPREFVVRNVEHEIHAKYTEEFLGYTYEHGVLTITFLSVGNLPAGVYVSDTFWQVFRTAGRAVRLSGMSPRGWVHLFYVVSALIFFSVAIALFICRCACGQSHNNTGPNLAIDSASFSGRFDAPSFKIPEKISLDVGSRAQQKASEDACGAGPLIEFYPQVVFSYATGGREGDHEGYGPGTLWTSALQGVLLDAGVYSYSGLTLPKEGDWWTHFSKRLGSSTTKVMVVVLTKPLLKSEKCLREIGMACKKKIPLIILRFDSDLQDRHLEDKWNNVKDSNDKDMLIQAITAPFDKLRMQHIPGTGNFADNDMHIKSFLDTVGGKLNKRDLYTNYSKVNDLRKNIREDMDKVSQAVRGNLDRELPADRASLLRLLKDYYLAYGQEQFLQDIADMTFGRGTSDAPLAEPRAGTDETVMIERAASTSKRHRRSRFR